ncbi:MAG: family 20 glycosylhydrolase [Paraprevotella sp.]|nr:family 20 glycosylhydrolase [Paraprevotella sp.]
MKNKLYQVLFTLLMAAGLGIAQASAMSATPDENNGKPFVIPELREWKGSQGTFELTSGSRILIQDEALKHVAQALADDYRTMFGHKLSVSCKTKGVTPRKGDIVITMKNEAQLEEEGYTIDIADHVTLNANRPVGAYWGTRTLLQILEQNEGTKLPKGYTLDKPDYALRGYMIDCARKFIPMDYLKNYVKIMAYYKMNTLQIHLNDNGFPAYFHGNWDETYSAFRMESDLFPGLTARDGHYGKKEFRQFQLDAANQFVEIIPEIDVPAHSLAFYHYRSYMGSKEYGVDHLDLFNPKVSEFLDSLFTEYLGGDEPVFTGKRVHIGTDEYSNRKKEVVEKFREFTDHYIRFVEKFGKQACVWGSLTHAKGDTPIKSKDVVMSLWNNGYANPKDMIEQGFQLININDGQTYIVPAAGYYYDYLNLQYLYNNWSPVTIGNQTFDPYHPQILGGMYAVWNDVVGNGISVKDIHHRAYPGLQAIAASCWRAHGKQIPFDQFNTLRHTLSEAPGVNELGRLSKEAHQTVMTLAEVKAGKATGREEIGYDYSVTFDIEYADETRGTILFSGNNAEFYLSDPISGMLGFSRDGYLNTFNYSVRPGVKETIRIEGDNRATRLFVDGRLVQELGYDERINHQQKKYNYLSTLVFPLRKAGQFKSRVTNLDVKNYCVSKDK